MSLVESATSNEVSPVVQAVKPKKRRSLPQGMREKMWQPGKSGNPGGRTIEYKECVRMAKEASPRAMQRLIELMESSDERVAIMAADKIMERAWGKPKEQPHAD